MSVIFIPSRASLDPSETIEWDQGGTRRRGSAIDDTNNQYRRADGSTLTVRHLKFFSNQQQGINNLLRIDNILDDWVDGNFAPNDKLLYTDSLSPKDGPMVITFSQPVSAAGANIQTNTYGEFTGVILAIDTDGLGFRFKRLGKSEQGNGTAIFLGIASPRSNIIRLEFSTINIVENGHANFDIDGFAINSLTIAG